MLLTLSWPIPYVQKYSRVFSPFWLCLLLALLVRVLLIVHTNGVLDGDEAVVGLQAEQILHGLFPVYFAGQPYMGSLEAYLVAVLFLFLGPSVWAMRLEAALLNVLLAALTWHFAGILSEFQNPQARRTYQIVAALCAALPPLYDGVAGMHMLGGYIETFVLIICLLVSVARLSQRWVDASRRELSIRFAGVGFLVGLGLWINPLCISVLAACFLWLAFAWLRQARPALLPALMTLPAAIIGCLPAIIWGAQNQWTNVSYILSLNSHERLIVRLMTAWQTLQTFGSCVSPRLIGGALPRESGVVVTLHAVLFVCGLLVVIGALVGVCISSEMRSLLALPLLFAGCAIFFYCISSASATEVHSCTNDWAGRYAVPVALTLPFFFGSVDIFIWRFRSAVLRGCLVALLVLLFVGQAIPYWQETGPQTFQSPFCLGAPWNNGPLLTYIQQQHIHYVWGTGFIVYPLVFKTDLALIGSDPLSLQLPKVGTNRFPDLTSQVAHANAVSLIYLIPHDDSRPTVLSYLSTLHVNYHVARFDAQPDYDVLIVTPDQSVPVTSLAPFGCYSS